MHLLQVNVNIFLIIVMVLMKMNYSANGATGMAINIEDSANTTDVTLNEAIDITEEITKEGECVPYVLPEGLLPKKSLNFI